MSLRVDAVKAMADVLQQRVKFPDPPAIIEAPPSEPANYPACSILLDKFSLVLTNSWDIEVDADGNPLVGTKASLDRGVGVAALEGGRYLSRFGSFRGQGRIWVAARHPSKRAEIEERVVLAFCEDGSAPGRMMVELVNAKVGDFTVPWPWNVAACITDATWRDEFVFVDRLWSYIGFSLDVDLLVPRTDPIVKTFLLAFNDENLMTDPSGDIVPAA